MDFDVFSILLLVGVLLIAGMAIIPALFGSPWHPLFPGTIRRILDFAEIQAGEKMFDLGSGDGRVLIAAAKHYGARGVGLEIDPVKVWLSRRLVRWAGVENRVRIIRKNLFDYDYKDADILYLYLTHQAIDRLFPAVLPHLKPTVKIVTFRFCLRQLAPDKVSADQTLFLYRLDKGNRVNRFS